MKKYVCLYKTIFFNFDQKQKKYCERRNLNDEIYQKERIS
jgi:hypothetical protein